MEVLEKEQEMTTAQPVKKDLDILAKIKEHFKSKGPKGSFLDVKTIIPNSTYRLNFWIQKDVESEIGSLIKDNKIALSMFIKVVKAGDTIDFLDQTKYDSSDLKDRL